MKKEFWDIRIDHDHCNKSDITLKLAATITRGKVQKCPTIEYETELGWDEFNKTREV
jgi:hypothetical protein